MTKTKENRVVVKEQLMDNIQDDNVSAFRKYQNFYIGKSSFLEFLQYELITFFFGAMPGAAGLFFRKQLYPMLFKEIGSGAVWGKNVQLRHPGKMKIGNRVAVDDNCMLDAKGVKDEGGFILGDDVLIASNIIVQGKASFVRIGDHSVIGSQTLLSSSGGIEIGKYVGIAGHCYIGGGRYHTDDLDIPILKQGVYSQGPVVIEDDVWIGANVVVQDGVRIGHGSVIGSGAIIREDVPPNTVVAPHQRLVMLPRSKD